MINEHTVKKNSIPVKSLALNIFNYLLKLKYLKTLIEFTYFFLDKVGERQHPKLQRLHSHALPVCSSILN